MKIRSTVPWPEEKIEAGQVVDLEDDAAKKRIAGGFAVEHVEADPSTEPPGGAHKPTDGAEVVPAVEAEAK